MEEVFGPVTPFVINTLVALLTEFVKRNFPALEGQKIQFVALGFSLLFIVPFQLLTAGSVTALGVYAALIYSLLGWFSAIGLYEVAAKLRP
jgi:hypothetical protein